MSQKIAVEDNMLWKGSVPDCHPYMPLSWLADVVLFLLPVFSTHITSVALLFHSGGHNDSVFRAGTSKMTFDLVRQASISWKEGPKN